MLNSLLIQREQPWLYDVKASVLNASENDNYERPLSFPMREDWEMNAIVEKVLTDWDPVTVTAIRLHQRFISDYGTAAQGCSSRRN